MNKISSVRINLAELASDSKDVGYICGSVISLDRTGQKIRSHDELVDHVRYRSKHELILNVAYKVGVGTHVVSILD